VLRRWSLVGLVLALFLVAAKTHGRQLRLERELAGYWTVIFGGHNPPFVEALWRRERLLFWSLAAVFVLLTLGVRFVASARVDRGVTGVLLFHVVVPLILAFVISGLLSLFRFASAVQAGAVTDPRPEDWLARAGWGSAAWWALTFILGAAVFAVARMIRRSGLA
jgi:hypothetical protein